MNSMKINQAVLYVLSGEPFTMLADGDEPHMGYVVAMPTPHRPAKLYSARNAREAVLECITEAECIEGTIGGWVNEDGQYALEAGVIVKDRAKAIRLGNIWQQYSIWDVANKREIVLSEV